MDLLGKGLSCLNITVMCQELKDLLILDKHFVDTERLDLPETG